MTYDNRGFTASQYAPLLTAERGVNIATRLLDRFCMRESFVLMLGQFGLIVSDTDTHIIMDGSNTGHLRMGPVVSGAPDASKCVQPISAHSRETR